MDFFMSLLILLDFWLPVHLKPKRPDRDFNKSQVEPGLLIKRFKRRKFAVY